MATRLAPTINQPGGDQLGVQDLPPTPRQTPGVPTSRENKPAFPVGPRVGPPLRASPLRLAPPLSASAPRLAPLSPEQHPALPPPPALQAC